MGQDTSSYNAHNAPGSEQGANAVGIAAQDYAKRVTKLIKLMTDLRALGAQTDIDLPRIVVIGNQSAGKSSLVEAISGITVPRASGTCTRCPMECRLQHSAGPWRCQVLLRYECDDFGRRLPASDIKEVKFGGLLHDKTLLEDTLRRAQLAILNPSVQASLFENYDLNNEASPPLGSKKQLQFSCNVVCLDLQSPDVTNLSFIDLPGIISNVAEGEDRNSIELIKNLVREHIEGNALILLTITMRDDIENQSAAFLAKEADPDGLRIIGALTKPDTLQEGEHAAWMAILNGSRHPLKHGYYVTKQPGNQELKVKLDHATAREKEEQFFSTDSNWANVKECRDRMGVRNLTAELSRLLSHLIEMTLPKLREDAREQLARTKEALKELPPPPPKNPVAELLRLVSEFSQDVNRSVMGLEKHESLVQECRDVYETYKYAILSTRPRFSALKSGKSIERGQSLAPATEVEAVSKDVPPLTEQVDSDSEDVMGGIEGEPTTKSDRPVMHVDEISQFIKSYRTTELPFTVPFPAKAALIRQCFKDWPGHNNDCFQAVRVAFTSCVAELAQRYFGRHTNGGLYDRIRTIVEKELDLVTENTKTSITRLLRLEERPFTQNDHYFSSCREGYLARFKGQRRKGRAKLLVENDEETKTALAALARIGILGLKREDLQKLLESDKYEQELIVMAEVWAYFRVAYKRTIDDLPRFIDLDFLQAFSENIHNALISSLGLGVGDESSARRVEAYLSEDPNTVVRRRELEGTKSRLESIWNRLVDFHSS